MTNQFGLKTLKFDAVICSTGIKKEFKMNWKKKQTKQMKTKKKL